MADTSRSAAGLRNTAAQAVLAILSVLRQAKREEEEEEEHLEDERGDEF
jgi:hypothetical protein